MHVFHCSDAEINHLVFLIPQQERTRTHTCAHVFSSNEAKALSQLIVFPAQEMDGGAVGA